MLSLVALAGAALAALLLLDAHDGVHQHGGGVPREAEALPQPVAQQHGRLVALAAENRVALAGHRVAVTHRRVFTYLSHVFSRLKIRAAYVTII